MNSPSGVLRLAQLTAVRTHVQRVCGSSSEPIGKCFEPVGDRVWPIEHQVRMREERILFDRSRTRQQRGQPFAAQHLDLIEGGQITEVVPRIQDVAHTGLPVSYTHLTLPTILRV